MAKGEVQIKDINVVKTYNQQLGDLIDSLNSHMLAFQQALDAKLEEFQAMKNEVNQEKEGLDYEIRRARMIYEESMQAGTYETEYYPDGSCDTHFTPDWGLRLQCQREYEHLAGPVYQRVSHYALAAHDRTLSARRDANYAINAMNSTKSMVFGYLNRGRQYISKMAPFIEQYIQNKIQ